MALVTLKNSATLTVYTCRSECIQKSLTVSIQKPSSFYASNLDLFMPSLTFWPNIIMLPALAYASPVTIRRHHNDVCPLSSRPPET